MLTPLPVNGLLYVGDPHVSSKPPGRRSAGYTAGVLEKLEFISELANKNNWQVVLLGDLIHRKDERDLKLVHKLLKVFRTFKLTPLDLEGNHGKDQNSLGEGDIEELLAEAGVLRLISSVGFFQAFQLPGGVVNLFGCRHGMAIPEFLSAEHPGLNVLVTHHDLAFGSGYPGAVAPPEVKGCAMAVNGHVHRTYDPLTAGETTWFNPGNIEPLSVDVRDHVPAVWLQDSASASLKRILLPHDAESAFVSDEPIIPAALSLAGDSDQPVATCGATGEQQGPRLAFIQTLLEQQAAGHQTTDATSIAQEVQEVLALHKPSAPTAAIVRGLLAKVQGPQVKRL